MHITKRRWTVLAALAGIVLGIVAWRLGSLGFAAWLATDSSGLVESHPSRMTSPFLPPDAPDEGWPFVRGPCFDGHSKELHFANSWPVDGPPVLWTRELGQGYSGFAIRDGRAFTQYQTLGGQYVACLDASTGKSLWEHRYGWPYEPAGLYPGPRATPTWADGRVYFASPTGLVGCLSEAGALLWSVDVIERFHAKGLGFGYACSPVVRRGRVLLAVGGKGASLVALDASNGATVWQAGDDAASYTPLLPISCQGRELLVGHLENALTCHDEFSGRLLWRKELSHGYDEHAAWPIYAEPHLWISGPFRGGSQLLELTGGGMPDATTVWHSKFLSNDVASSVLANGRLFGFDLREAQSKVHRPSRGEFRCLDFLTGEVRWSTDSVGHASVIVVDGKLLLFNDKGELILAKAGGDRYEELARASVLAGDMCWTPPAIDRGRAFVRNHSRAVCLYLGEPSSFEADAAKPLRLADIPQGKTRDWSFLLGVEPEYSADAPSMLWLRDWHLWSLAMLAIAAALSKVVGAACKLVRVVWPTPVSGRALGRFTSFCLGAVGTTGLSHCTDDFVFTWPLCLFVLYQVTIDHVRWRDSPVRPGDVFHSGAAAAGLALGAVGYYFLCRRLGLATEWAFLCGFAAAVPLSVVRLRWLQPLRPNAVVETVVVGLEFSAYYWASAAVLIWRCREAIG